MQEKPYPAAVCSFWSRQGFCGSKVVSILTYRGLSPDPRCKQWGPATAMTFGFADGGNRIAVSR